MKTIKTKAYLAANGIKGEYETRHTSPSLSSDYRVIPVCLAPSVLKIKKTAL